MTKQFFRINKERKVILIAGAIIILLGVLYRFFPFFQNIESLDEEIAIKHKQLEKYRKMVQERNELEANRIALSRILERAEASLLGGETPALAAVDIQNTINEIAGKTEVEVMTMRVLKADAKEEELYLAVPVQVTIRCKIRQLKEILYQIENSSKLLRISELRVRVIRSKEEGEIQATLTVEGFMKKV